MGREKTGSCEEESTPQSVGGIFFELNNTNDVKLKNTCYNINVRQLKSHLISLQEEQKEQKKHTLAALKE